MPITKDELLAQLLAELIIKMSEDDVSGWSSILVGVVRKLGEGTSATAVLDYVASSVIEDPES